MHHAFLIHPQPLSQLGGTNPEPFPAMTDVRARLAALRAKRQERKASLTAKFPANTDPALAAAAAAVGEPQQSWDVDFQERLAGKGDSSEEEEDQIVVLPPPPVRLDPIAARIAWRKKAIAEANKKTQAILAKEFPVARLPAPAVKMPAEVNDEEELLLEQEVDEEEDGDYVGSDEEEEGDEGEDADDEADEAESMGEESMGKKCDDPMPVDEEPKADTGVVKALLAKVAEKQVQDEKETSSSALVSSTSTVGDKPEKESTTDGAMKTTKGSVVDIDAVCRDVDMTKNAINLDATPVTPEDSYNAADSQPAQDAAPSKKEVLSPPDDSGKTTDSSRITAELATGSHSTAKSITKCAQGLKKGDAVTANSSREGPFSKFFTKQLSPHTEGATVSSVPATATAPAPPMKSAFIDDEASDEGEEDEADLVQIYGDSEEEEDAMKDDGVVADSTPPGNDAARLAQFHRQWEEEQDDVAVGGGGHQNCNVDDAIDLSELLAKQKENKERDAQEAEEGNDAGAGSDDAASEFCMGNMSLEDSRNAAGEYADKVDAMFRDDNSRSAFDDEMDLITPEKNSADAELSKRKARALWKARQRNRAATGGADDRSISLLALFEGDAECENTTAARPPLGAKRKNTSRRDPSRKEKRLPEWERRRVILERVEKRRRTAVSMDQWSYASASLDRESRDAATVDGKQKAKRGGAAPVGGGSSAPKPSSVQEIACVAKRAARKSGKKGGGKKPSAFKALFDVLDQRPTTDVA